MPQQVPRDRTHNAFYLHNPIWCQQRGFSERDFFVTGKLITRSCPQDLLTMGIHATYVHIQVLKEGSEVSYTGILIVFRVM